MSSKNNLKNKYGTWALIAGGSEGIGRSFAEEIAASGMNLILLGRRVESLRTCADEITTRYGVSVEFHALDIRSIDELKVKEIIDGREVGLLIYNAGATHGAALFHEQPLADALGLVELNCRGPLLLCHVIGQGMRARGKGGIVLMSSVAALWGGSYIAAYAASKAFDIVLAQSLWHELKPYGVDVLCAVAGATDTPAMARSGVEFSKFGAPMKSEDVAREALQNLGVRPTWICGEDNRARVAGLQQYPLEQCIEMMSQGTMMLYGKPAPGSNSHH